MKIAFVVSQFNPEVTDGLLAGAKTYLAEHKINTHPDDVFSAPGAFEIPLIAQSLAKTKKYAGIICLGCVIKGDTAHFEFISLGATIGVLQANLNAEIPISFGILTAYNEDQATARSRADAHNKGREAAAAVVQTIQCLDKIRSL